MPFVQGKCENCGSLLSVDPNLKTANCPFCGAAYVMQDFINNYNQSYNVEHLHADVVTINDTNSAEARLKAAEAYIRLKKYQEAEAEYCKVTKMVPQDYRGWWGLVISNTNEFTKRLRSEKSQISYLDDCIKSIKTFAPIGIQRNLLDKYERYISSERLKNQNDKNLLISQINQLKAQLSLLESEEQRLYAMRSNDERMNNPKLSSPRDWGYFGAGILEGLAYLFSIVLIIFGSLAFLGGMFNLGGKYSSGRESSTIALGIIILVVGIVINRFFSRSEKKKTAHTIELGRSINDLSKRKYQLKNELENKLAELNAYE